MRMPLEVFFTRGYGIDIVPSDARALETPAGDGNQENHTSNKVTSTHYLILLLALNKNLITRELRTTTTCSSEANN